MMELFNKYKDSGAYAEALMVGRNLFNKDSGNTTVFKEYFNLLCSQAKDSGNSIAERRQFISQAEVALAFFSENVEMDEPQVKKIKTYESQLTTIVKAFNEEVDKQNALEANEARKKNNEALTLLDKLYNKLQKLNDKQEFDKVLKQISDIDNILNKSAFDTPQQERYNLLTKSCSEIINKKLVFFQRNENVVYNQQAIEAYKSVFDFLKTNEYNNKNHKEIMKNFFSFDASRLFNETLVYYNHVYSYVLSKMNDDEKFLLTKYAVMSERKEG